MNTSGEMDKTQVKVKVEFCMLSSILTKVELLKKIGSNSKVIGGDKDDLLGNGEKSGYSFWEISTEYEESLDINNQIQELMPQIKRYKDQLIEIVREGEGRFCIVVKIENGETPAMLIDKQLISLASELNAEIEFDIYANPYTSEF